MKSAPNLKAALLLHVYVRLGGEIAKKILKKGVVDCVKRTNDEQFSIAGQNIELKGAYDMGKVKRKAGYHLGGVSINLRLVFRFNFYKLQFQCLVKSGQTAIKVALKLAGV